MVAYTEEVHAPSQVDSAEAAQVQLSYIFFSAMCVTKKKQQNLLRDNQEEYLVWRLEESIYSCGKYQTKNKK